MAADQSDDLLKDKRTHSPRQVEEEPTGVVIHWDTEYVIRHHPRPRPSAEVNRLASEKSSAQ